MTAPSRSAGPSTGCASRRPLPATPRGRAVPPREVGDARACACSPTSAGRRGGAAMLTKRIIVCLDVRDGKTTKGVRFQEQRGHRRPGGDGRGVLHGRAPTSWSSTTSRPAPSSAGIMIDVVRRVAETIFIPFSVGGGICVRRGHAGGAPRRGREGERQLPGGAQPARSSTRAPRRSGASASSSAWTPGPTAAMPSGYRVFIDGGRTAHGARRPGLGPGGREPRRRRDRAELHRRRRHPRRLRAHRHADAVGERRHSRWSPRAARAGPSTCSTSSSGARPTRP